jgi:hypothetical protein
LAIVDAIMRQNLALESLVLVLIRVNPYIEQLSNLKGLTMSNLIRLIKALAPHLQSQKALDDAYLAQATDICDLESRMQGDRCALRGQLLA